MLNIVSYHKTWNPSFLLYFDNLEARQFLFDSKNEEMVFL